MEEYVTKEIALLLKELGFDGYCMAYYREADETLIQAKERVDKVWIENHSNKNHTKYYLAPTQQMAKKWLKEVHQIYIRDDYRIIETENRSYGDYYIEAKNMKNNNLLYYGAFDNLEFGINRVILYILRKIKG